MGGAIPPFLLGLLAYIFMPQLLLPFALAYFLCWALYLPELQSKIENKNYRFSLLRFIFFIYSRISTFNKWNSERITRIATAVVISAPFVLLADLYFIGMFLLGISVFEIWFFICHFLHEFPKS